MNFSIIICTYNRQWLLSKTITSVNKQDYQLRKLEIVIVDNNPPQNKEFVYKCNQKFEKLDIEYFSEKRRGISYASNLGLKKSSNDIVIFIDDDEILPRNFCKNYASLWRKYKGDNVHMIGGPIKPIFDNKATKEKYLKNKKFFATHHWIFGILTMGKKEFQLQYPHSLFSGNFSLMRSEILKIGGFDNNLGSKKKVLYFYGHDVELCHRILLKGGKIIYSPKILAYNLVSEERFAFHNLLSRYFRSAFEMNFIDKKLIGISAITKNSYIYIYEFISNLLNLNIKKVFQYEYLYRTVYIFLTVYNVARKPPYLYRFASKFLKKYF